MFLIRSLDIGGAQRQIVVLARGLIQLGHEVSVAVFYPGGKLEADLHDDGVKVIPLNKSGRWDVIPFFIRLHRIVSCESPDVVYGFLGTSNILAVLLKMALCRLRVVWGVRASSLDLGQYDWFFRFGCAVESRLSKYADLIICNSRAGLEYSAGNGFPRQKMIVIPNGIDTEKFKPDSSARERTRREWGIGEDEMLIGLAARIDPMKGHPIFIRAAALLIGRRRGLRFVCVGDGEGRYKAELRQLACELGLDDSLIWAGARSDMPAVFNSLDFSVSSSCYGEGFSNSIAEAMSCGVPCVATDVGDSSFVVGDTGRVVRCDDPAEMAEALMSLIEESEKDKAGRRQAVRDRVLNEFSVFKLARHTESCLKGMHAERETSIPEGG